MQEVKPGLNELLGVKNKLEHLEVFSVVNHYLVTNTKMKSESWLGVGGRDQMSIQENLIMFSDRFYMQGQVIIMENDGSLC